MSKYEKVSECELNSIKRYLEQYMGGNMQEHSIEAISGIVVDPEWAYTQEWYRSMYCNLHEIELEDEEDYSSVTMQPHKLLVPPKYIIRILDENNEGTDILIDVVDEQYIWWGMEDTPISLVDGTIMNVESTDFYGSAPAYQGCYGDDPEATEWVEELYEDAEDVWL